MTIHFVLHVSSVQQLFRNRKKPYYFIFNIRTLNNRAHKLLMVIRNDCIDRHV